ncbi:MAG: RpoL/Rpb11 RNA polymerase subunit family protein [Promethearchaeota archaeon]
MSDEDKEYEFDSEKEIEESDELSGELLEEEVHEPIVYIDNSMDPEEEASRALRKLFVKEGGKISNDEANLIVTDESHGFCNVIKRYLLKNEHVLFASYKKIFYQDPTIFLNTDGKVAALDVVVEAADTLYVDLSEMDKLFTDQVKKFK